MHSGPNDCVHLTVAQIGEIHAAVLEEFGGLSGIADQGLLEAAVAAPQASAFGQSPYADLAEVAAAYLFYLCRNHPFQDGNKRTAMTAAIVFLRLNGVEPRPDSPAWESLVIDVAASRLDRAQTTQRLRKLLKPVRR
ncbi:MAG: type II toxin-antitoxin system death-on-curing family toxin [Opitutaceae bacterium]|nr:type II toxin-antitoxin system death-on-curing family toxin [Opitutaceae bacterium]